MDTSRLRSFILSVVGSLKPGKFVDQSGQNATMDNLYPDGGFSSRFRLTSPFGFIASVPRGVTGFYHNLFGSAHETILLAQLDENRPQPSGPGEVVLYSTNSTGAAIQVKITLGPDGTLTISSPVKTSVVAPLIELGESGLEKILNGETFQTFFNNHQHLGNLGTPTGAVMEPSGPEHLSKIVKAGK